MENKGNVHVKKIPMRQCTGCNERKEKKSLIRIIRTPEDEIAVDFTGKKSLSFRYILHMVYIQYLTERISFQTQSLTN